MTEREYARAYIGAQQWDRPVLIPSWMLPYAKEMEAEFTRAVHKERRRKRHQKKARKP